VVNSTECQIACQTLREIKEENLESARLRTLSFLPPIQLAASPIEI